MKSRFHLCIAVLLAAKLLLGSLVAYHLGWEGIFTQPGKAVASELQPEAAAAPEPDLLMEGPVDLKLIGQKQQELEQQARQIAREKAELATIQADINRKIEELQKIRTQIREAMEQQRAAEAAESVADQKKMKHLIKAYSAMKPQSAATLIEKLDLDLAVKLLANMKGDDVGNILAFIDVEKAAVLSKGLIKEE